MNMNNKMIYLPLEGYKQRYTHQWSAPNTGWLERRWLEHNIPYERIDGRQTAREIKVGSVVDGIGRSIYCFSQIEQVLLKMECGEIDSNTVIYFDDFWHPGIEAIPYAADLLNIKPKLYAFCHAQSVDEYDFTRPMIDWIRPLEKSYFNLLDGMFVCCPRLRSLTSMGFKDGAWDRSKEKEIGESGSNSINSISNNRKIHITGHPFATDEVLERMPEHLRNTQLYNAPAKPRKNRVVWSSRWDWEKNPLMFIFLARQVIKNIPDAEFVICTSAKNLKSNKPELLTAALAMQDNYPRNFKILEDLSKEEYYEILAESKIQFNSALQDWVAITLLEATAAGCFPVYPYFRSFPETFLQSKRYTYEYIPHPTIDPKDKDTAKKLSASPYDKKQEHAFTMATHPAAVKVEGILKREDLWTTEQIHRRNWIHDRFKLAWAEQIRIMGLADDKILSLIRQYNPFSIEYVRSNYPNAAI